MTDDTSARPAPTEPGSALNIAELELAAKLVLDADVLEYLQGGADDGVTLRANASAFERRALRPRRLVDVSRVDTALELFGERLRSPILLAPVGFQRVFHEAGELASARAASASGHRMIASTVSSASIGEIAEAAGEPVWFQLYPTTERRITRALLERAEAAGCTVVAPTLDTPVFGNRESHGTTLQGMIAGSPKGNLDDLLGGEELIDPSLDWDYVGWLRANTSMRLLLKGIVTAEDAALALERGVDGLIVSNHGGRQLGAGRATIDCLPEVVSVVEGRIPVLLDGGIRRGTDVLQALALGARAVCVGRPYVWGLAAFGQAGVERALSLLQAELVRGMQLVGAPTLGAVGPELVCER